MTTQTVRALRAAVSRYDGLPLHLQPRGRATALVAALARVERLREELAAKAIAELDALEAPLEDLEDDEREPPEDAELDMGGLGDAHNQARWGYQGGDEGDDEPDREPMLGAPESKNVHIHTWTAAKWRMTCRPLDQTHWADGGDVGDREDVSEDEGAQCDDEGVRDNEDGCVVEDGGGEGSLGWSEGETLRGRLTSKTEEYEPLLGSNEGALDQRKWASALLPSLRDEDLEAVCEDEGAQCDDEGMCGLLDPDTEHSLGRSESILQSGWEYSTEFELDNCDAEPSLGASPCIDQRRWAQGQRQDLETQCDDEGEDGGDTDATEAACQHFRDEDGRQTWPPVLAP